MMLRALLLVLLLTGALSALDAAHPVFADPTIRTADQPLADPAGIAAGDRRLIGKRFAFISLHGGRPSQLQRLSGTASSCQTEENIHLNEN